MVHINRNGQLNAGAAPASCSSAFFFFFTVSEDGVSLNGHSISESGMENANGRSDSQSSDNRAASVSSEARTTSGWDTTMSQSSDTGALEVGSEIFDGGSASSLSGSATEDPSAGKRKISTLFKLKSKITNKDAKETEKERPKKNKTKVSLVDGHCGIVSQKD